MYDERERLRHEILKRSSRSDNVFMIPYGKKLYRVLVIVEADLMGESEDNIRASILSSLENFYNDITEVRDPIESVIYHKIHSSNSAIARAWVVLISEFDDAFIENFPTEDFVTNPDSAEREAALEGNGILRFFYNLLPDNEDYDPSDPSSIQKTTDFIDRYSELQPKKDAVISQNLLTASIESLSHYHGNLESSKSSYEYKYPDSLPYSNVNEDLSLVDENSASYYDSPDIDTMSVEDDEYAKTHFILPSLFDTIIWVYST